MSPSLNFSLAEVLAVAKIHPFYSNATYPPTENTLQTIREQAAVTSTKANLVSQPLLHKHYTVIQRLVNDTSPENTYRHNVYASTTGGGGGLAKPMFFATDAIENRRQRAAFGQFLQNTGIIQRGDWVLSTHYGGNLYRSLDLTLETMENAGATVLAAGNSMSPQNVIQLLEDFHVNVLTGDGSQVVTIIHHIATLQPAVKANIKLNKIIYTSEGLTPAQRSYIYAVLGPVKICSVLGSAEAGPYGASNPDLIPHDPVANHAEFVIDTRMNLIEILSQDMLDDGCIAEPLSEGESGIVVQTSLARLRNPLVRYITGDVGSLHPLPEKARALVSQEYWPHLRVLRLKGRDRRFSFEWHGEYIDFDGLHKLMSDPQLGILQWQVIIDRMEISQEVSLEVRLLHQQQTGDASSPDALMRALRAFFRVDASNGHRFSLVFVHAITDFKLSGTGQKVVNFINNLD